MPKFFLLPDITPSVVKHYLSKAASRQCVESQPSCYQIANSQCGLGVRNGTNRLTERTADCNARASETTDGLMQQALIVMSHRCELLVKLDIILKDLCYFFPLSLWTYRLVLLGYMCVTALCCWVNAIYFNAALTFIVKHFCRQNYIGQYFYFILL